MKKELCLIATVICVISSLFAFSACGGKEVGGGDKKGVHTHKYTETIVVQATCGKAGKIKYDCDFCEETYTENVKMPEYTGSELYDKAKASIGEIVTKDKSGRELSLGTGFIYNGQGHVVTNYHVIEDMYSATITINNIKYKVKNVLAYDKEIDLAVLGIDAPKGEILPICKESHTVGTTVYAVGSSQGLTNTFSQGIITYDNRELDGVYYVQHDAAISSGNSGGPLINAFGEIIGINTMTLRDSQNLNFAISVKELSNLKYGTPLTVGQFYEKECDVFAKMKNYIIQNGEYDYEDGDYTLDFGWITTNSGARYNTSGVYDVSDKEITLELFWASATSSYMVFVYIDKVDGSYEWSYIDDDYYYMRGTLYASTFTDDSLLSVSSYTCSSYLFNSTRKLASSLVQLLLTNVNLDYTNINVTAADLGFKYF